MIFALAASLLASTGCATRPAPDFRGRWQPVNRYSEATQGIPLHQAYLFHPAPMDRTLKTMLERWTRDSKMALDYGHPSDFTLHAPVARIQTADLHDALGQLNAIYAPQQVSIVLADGRVLVRQADAPAPRTE